MPEYRERAPGNYPARFVKLDENYPITDRETGQEMIRWRWVFQEVADPTTMGEMDTLTTPGFKSRSNGLKFFTGMLGRAPKPGDNTDTLVGEVFDVSFGPNQNGRFTIVNVTKPVTKSAQSEVRDAKAGRDHAAAINAAQEGDVVDFRGAKVAVTDPDDVTAPAEAVTEDLPF
jgi:hypothetical protein